MVVAPACWWPAAVAALVYLWRAALLRWAVPQSVVVEAAVAVWVVAAAWGKAE